MLSVPEEQAGISGPCPFCATEVTSPMLARVAAVPVRGLSREGEESPGWKRAVPMTAEQTVLPGRARHTGWKVAACVGLFAGGVAGTVKLWDRERPGISSQSEQEETPLVTAPRPRPPVLARADEGASLPPPADTVPAAPPPAPGALARNVSTASPRAARVPVVPPAPVSQPTLFPENEAAVQAGAAASHSKETAPARMSAEEKEIRRVVPATGALAVPGGALINFFAAKNWQERLPYCLAAEKVKPLMEAYYKVQKDGPIVPEDIELTRMEPVEEDPARHYFAFMVYFPGRVAGVPLSVEETKTGCLVEWTSFAEGKDLVLEKFCAGYRKETGTFRVLVRRGHYFEKDVPDQDGKLVLDVCPPDRSGPYKVWLEKESVAATQHFSARKFDWDTVAMMVVTLQWEKSADGVEYLRLREVAADSWHPEMLATK